MRRVSEGEGLVGEGLGIRENERKVKSDPYLFLTIYIENWSFLHDLCQTLMIL